MGADYPKKMHPSPGAPATSAPPLAFGTAKAATDPGKPGCAKPMHRVSASACDERSRVDVDEL